MSNSLYVLYQAWAFCRQLVRFCLVTLYAIRASKRLSWPLRLVIGLDNSAEAKKIQEQSSLVYNGFTLGPFMPIDEKTTTLAVLAFVFAFWMTLLVLGSSSNNGGIVGNPVESLLTTTLKPLSNVHSSITRGSFQSIPLRSSPSKDLNILLW